MSYLQSIRTFKIAVEEGLDIVDLTILDYLATFHSFRDAQHIQDGGMIYTKINYDRMVEDLAILNVKKTRMKQLVYNLREAGFLEFVVRGSHNGKCSYFALTNKALSDLYGMPVREMDTSVDEEGETEEVTAPAKEPDEVGSHAYGPKENNMRTYKDLKQKKTPKTSLQIQCETYISHAVPNSALQTALNEYLRVRIAMTDKPLHGLEQWIALVRKLDSFTNSVEEKIKIVRQSTEHGWASFYELSAERNVPKNDPDNGLKLSNGYRPEDCDQWGCPLVQQPMTDEVF